MSGTAVVDRARLRELLARERETYLASNPRSAAAYAAGQEHLFGGVPMTWMNKAAGGVPLFLSQARGASGTDLDRHTYVDFCLGDTRAMARDPPPATVAAGREPPEGPGGGTVMMPTEDAAWGAGELARRFGLPYWSFSLTATDANRWAIRLARQVTGRPKILVNSWCYHGTVDEVLIVVGDSGEAEVREGNVGAPVDVRVTTRVVEFNDIEALERELSYGDVACVLMEPALTNIGIVLPEPGYLEAVRSLTRAAGTLLINDETHTLSAGPGGMTADLALEPDIVTLGKAIAGGIAIGAYGLSAEVAAAVTSRDDVDLIDTGGVGGTLAGNALSMAAARATLSSVLTDDAFIGMKTLAGRFTEGVQQVINTYDLPWSVVQLGARSEYRFASPAPRTGGESNAAADPELEDYLHVALANRGVLLTPFHSMALMCPATTEADVDRHTEEFTKVVAELLT